MKINLKSLMKDKLDSFGNYDYISYIIGSMENTAEGDGGEKKRVTIVEELKKRRVFPINPCTLEMSKVGMNATEFKNQMRKWKSEGDFSEYKKASRLIWKGKDIINEKGELIHIPGDFDYVYMSDFITFMLHKGDQPCGSYGEAFCAFNIEKPVYLITNIPLMDLKDSLTQSIFGSGGYIFETENAYLNFIENEYNLKLK